MFVCLRQALEEVQAGKQALEQRHAEEAAATGHKDFAASLSLMQVSQQRPGISLRRAVGGKPSCRQQLQGQSCTSDPWHQVEPCCNQRASSSKSS